MNDDIIKGKWTQLKGELVKAWGNVTESEWDKTKGDLTAIAGIVQEKYGYAKEEAAKRVSDVVGRLRERADASAEKDRARADGRGA